MDDECQKLLAEKDAIIRELQDKIKELESKIRSYEIRSVYQGIIPDEVLEEFMKLPPDQMVIEIGKYLREKAINAVEKDEKIAKAKESISEVTEKIKEAENLTERVVEQIEGTARAKVGVDLTFTQKYDHEGSAVAFLGEDIMRVLGAEEGDYVTVRKNGSVNLRVVPYSKPGFIVIPSWVREKLGVKINDFVEVSKR